MDVTINCSDRDSRGRGAERILKFRREPLAACGDVAAFGKK